MIVMRARETAVWLAKELLETAGAETPERNRRLELLQTVRRVRPQDVTVMTRQFATLLSANLTVVDALTALIEQTENRTLQRTLIQVRESVLEGSSLATALGQHRRVFAQLFVNMVRAGEASGALPLVMLRLADFSERQLNTRKKITAKMYYPLFMVAVGGLILFALLTYVVPTVTTLFTNMRGTLPLPTVVLIRVSNFLQAYWWLLGLGLLGSFLALRRYGRTTKGERLFDTWKIRAPLVGKLALKVAMSRFTRTMGILLQRYSPARCAGHCARCRE
jgi:general secretion pathway protein F